MSTIYEKERNPVRKIPLIHRILSFAASDVLQAEQLSTTCSEWRESVEDYGKALFAGFAERDPRDFFRFFYQVIDHRDAKNAANGVWMASNMVRAWNDNSYRILKDVRRKELAEKRKKENVFTTSTSSSNNKKKIKKGHVDGGEDEDDEDDDPNYFEEADFFTNRFMKEVEKSYGYPVSVGAARNDQTSSVLRVLHENGCDLDSARDTFGANAWQVALEKINMKALIEMCEIRAERQGAKKRENRIFGKHNKNKNTNEDNNNNKIINANTSKASPSKQVVTPAKGKPTKNNILKKKQQQQLLIEAKFKNILVNLPPLPKVVSPDAVAQGLDDDENDMSRKIGQGIRNNGLDDREGQDECSAMEQLLKDFEISSDVNGRFLSKAVTYDLRTHLGGKCGRRRYRQILSHLGMMLTKEASDDLSSNDGGSGDDQDDDDDDDDENSNQNNKNNNKAQTNKDNNNNTQQRDASDLIELDLKKIYCFCRFPLYCHEHDIFSSWETKKIGKLFPDKEKAVSACQWMRGHKKLQFDSATSVLSMIPANHDHHDDDSSADASDSSVDSDVRVESWEE